MKSNRNLLPAGLLAAGALLTAAAGISIAAAADEATPAIPATPAAPGPHGWHHHHRGAGHLLSKLNLSAEQQASVKNIMATAAPQMKSIHQEMRNNSLKLKQTQPTDANYASVVAQVGQANGSLHSQMITQREAARAQIFKVLTPEQQAQLKALQAQMQARRG
ncbi:MAG TPA: Spy/CpxP family protein refolding chaperone [Steroidobacteraceae bacterium]|jgi:Spy/CpxP family protein refolding chaperone|nr:Spy/CpxP family protein refolding chaperone [Steroidobacteraceae bacterium]